MKDKTTRTIALIAMILQGLAVFAAIIVVMFQKPLSALVSYHATSDIMVIPSTVIFLAVHLAIYVLMFWITQSEDSENKRILTIILVIISAVLGIVSLVGNVFESILLGRRGEDYLVRLTAVNSLVAYSTMLFTTAAAPLYYIACGRYLVNTKSPKTNE